MNAVQFLASFAEVLPCEYPERRRPRRGRHVWRGADWTAWMTEKLHEVGRRNEISCCCKDPGHSATFGREEDGRTRGYRKEYRFDYTWFRNWDWNALPDVIIEHENSGSWSAFLTDHWKLMMAYAPLRVSFGYHGRPAELEGYCARLNDLGARQGWRFPSDSEDVSLLGHVNMAPDAYRVLLRRPGQVEWRDLGLLRAAVASLQT